MQGLGMREAVGAAEVFGEVGVDMMQMIKMSE
jgi:hypothetical protein